MQWSVAQAAEALSIAAPSALAPLSALAGVSIDSRTVQSGELFVAIHGPNHDGHDHVADALEKGAAAGLVARERLPEYPAGIQGRLFAVNDTLDALQLLAKRSCERWRRERPGRLIAGVAGSVGKTSTKEILAALLGARFRVLKTRGNLNNEYGLPLTLLQLDDAYDAAVVELGMSHSGELAHLTRIASPDVGVVTRVAVEHLEFFASIEEIALAERELVENLPWPRATAVLNADDERVARFVEVARGPAIFFGTGPGADFRAEAIEEHGIEGSEFDFVSPAGRARLASPLIGRHNVMNAVAALAAASVWGIGADEARSVFPLLKPANKRGEVVRFEEGFTVINDSYNSSPAALNELTRLLAGTPGYRRRILAAGEMRELGPTSAELHRECGRAAAALGNIDWIFGVQSHAEEFVRSAMDAGHSIERSQFFENSEEAGTFLADFLQRGDLLLLKGSRGVKMEKILDAIEARHARAPESSPAQPRETSRTGPA
jgi:UDP-N-acetylmuramoyl-tripeptide--D-alanyl-D-alanine ligase